MSEPISTTAATAAATSAGMLTAAGVIHFLNGEAGIVLAAFGGASVSILNAHTDPLWRRLVWMTISFVLGITFAEFAAALVAHFVPAVTVPASLGAALAAATIVGILKLAARSANAQQPFQLPWSKR